MGYRLAAAALLLPALFPTAIQAVDIGLYSTRVFGDCTNVIPNFICVSIGENACCSQGRTVNYFVTRFLNLPRVGALDAFGINFVASSTTACGTSCNSGTGHPVLCLDCAGNTYQGALWVLPNPGKERRDTMTATLDATEVGKEHSECQYPDLGVIDGHYFNLGEAGEDLGALEKMIAGGIKFEEVPEEYHKYENSTYTWKE